MKKSTTVTSLLFLALAIGAFVASMKLPFGTLSAPAAAFFPAVLAALLAMTALLALVSALRSSDETAIEPERLRWKKIFLTVGSLLVFALLFESLGYLAATFLFIVFLLRAVEQKSWGLAGCVAVLAVVFFFFFFFFLL